MKFRVWLPVKVEQTPNNINQISKLQVRCLQQVSRGEANADEQKIAIQAILWICGTDDMEFLPDEHGGERDSAFKSGRRYVGTQLRKLINLPLTLLTGETNE